MRRFTKDSDAIQGIPVQSAIPEDGQVLAYEAATATYKPSSAAGGGAPTTADYLVKTANAGLSAELVITDTATVTWDWSTPGQAKANAAGGASATETEVDFGTTPVYDASFTITDATVSGTSKITVTQSGKTATSRVDGDAQWDSIVYAANPAAGSFTLYALALPGPVVGKRKIVYTVAA